MLTNQDGKLSSDSVVLKHNPGKHDQAAHGGGKAGATARLNDANAGIKQYSAEAADLDRDIKRLESQSRAAASPRARSRAKEQLKPARSRRQAVQDELDSLENDKQQAERELESFRFGGGGRANN